VKAIKHQGTTQAIAEASDMPLKPCLYLRFGGMPNELKRESVNSPCGSK
jgi:hypothetical protein